MQNFLGALDVTNIKVNVRTTDRLRYRTRRSEVATNVLDVCDTKSNFVFVLACQEGSVADLRILRDAISRSNGLKVPKGNYVYILTKIFSIFAIETFETFDIPIRYYYLCDVGYPNAEGFMALYRGQRYICRSGVVRVILRRKSHYSIFCTECD